MPESSTTAPGSVPAPGSPGSPIAPGSAATESPASGRRVLPPVYLLVSAVVLVLLDWYLPLATWVEPPWTRLGWGLVVLGIGGVLVTAAMFRRHHTTIRPFQTSDALVTGGLFRLSRNPIYLGMVCVLVGLAVVGGSASAWVVPPVFAWIIDRRFIRVEEAMLAERFGEDYAHYRRRVRRWI